MKKATCHIFFRLFLLCSLFVFAQMPTLLATHIVGGELRYRCLGDDRYEIHLTLHRECSVGSDAAGDDFPAYVAVYDGNNQLIRTIGRGGIIIMDEQTSEEVSGRIEGECRTPVNDNICYEEVTACAFIDLPFREGGYQIVYQRCCRNATITNVVDPLNVGMTLVSEITEEALMGCNNAAIMSAYPPIYACENEAFVKTVTASDVDGDELVYRLYTPKNGGTLDEPRPLPPSAPPHEEIPWANGFSEEDMMSGDVPFTIDPVTGVISGTPGLIGQFVVGVAVEEYREGSLINTTTREYQINVRECQDLIVGDIDTNVITACEGQEFIINADGDSLFSYEWSPAELFDDPNAVSPMLTLTEDVIINVVLTDEEGCSTEYNIPIDVISAEGNLDFDYDYDCQGTDVELFATSLSEGLQNLTWTLMDNVIGTGDSITYSFPDTGVYEITLSAETPEGCLIGLTQEVAVIPFVFDIEDSLFTCAIGDTVELNSTGEESRYAYQWSGPGINESNDTLANPRVVITEDTLTYNVLVTDRRSPKCSDSFTITVMVGTIIELNLDSIVEFCPGRSFILNSDGSDNFSYSWMPADLFDDPEATSPELTILSDSSLLVQVLVTDATGCDKLYEIQLSPTAKSNIDLGLDSIIEFCPGATFELNPEGNPDYIYSWMPAELFDDPEAINPEITITSDSTILIQVLVTDSTGCSELFDIVLSPTAETNIDLGLDSIIEFCPGLTFELNPEGNPDYTYAWMPADLFDDPEAVNPELLLFADTTIQVLVTDSTGCSELFEIQLVPFDPGFDLGFLADYPCEGTEITLVDTMGGNVVSREWILEDMIISTADSFVYDFGMFGDYEVILRIEADNGCTYDVAQTVRAIPFDPNVGQSRSTCIIGDSVELNPMGSDLYNYRWSGPGITNENRDLVNPVVVINSNAEFTVIIVDPINQNCNAVETVRVSIESDRELIDVDTASVCTDIGNQIVVTDVEIYDDVVWFDPNGNIIDGGNLVVTDSFNASGYYVVQVTEDSCTYRDSVYIDARPYTATVNPAGAFCENDTVSVIINTEGEIALEEVICEGTDLLEVISIIGNQIDVIIRGSDVLDGDLVYTDGCVRPFFTETLLVGNLEGLSITASRDTIFDGETATITVEGAPEGSTFNWQPQEYISSGQGTNSITVSPPRTITFTVEVQDPSGCQVTLSRTIVVLNPMCTDEAYFIPNAFTPNNDGVNDEWCVKSRFIEGTTVEEIESVLLVVYDRWGTEIFKQEGPPQSVCWDGIFEGEVVGTDVYGYYARMLCIGGIELESRGNVTLLR